MSPSGRLLSCLTNPEGSLVAGIPAEPIDLQMMSFKTWYYYYFCTILYCDKMCHMQVDVADSSIMDLVRN